ncbi:hypothetical protein [Micromonospora sp. NPDC049891]|uniref:hypothetical protein n=1 Tax=Micromonospora sp. NPDC049891 TaxID=3155655 RepID=UPI003402BE12
MSSRAGSVSGPGGCADRHHGRMLRTVRAAPGRGTGAIRVRPAAAVRPLVVRPGRPGHDVCRWVEGQVPQQAGGVGGDHPQPVLGRLPRSPRPITGLSGGPTDRARPIDSA